MSLGKRAGVEAKMETEAEGPATRVAHENTLCMMRDPRTGIDDFILVRDEEMRARVRLLLEHTRNVAEMGGAASLAASVNFGDRFAGKKIAVILSGGNIAMDKLRRILR